MQFSDVSGKTGILERTRQMARVDAIQWPTLNVANSCNDWMNKILTKGKILDIKFPIDDANHTHLPEGTDDIVANQSDYSFLVDQDGNRITNLTAISLIEIATNKEIKLFPVDRNNLNYDFSSFGVSTGTPSTYDKIADNVIRLNTLPTASDASKYKIKYYFQRSPSYFVATDTTKKPGVADDLHRGFVVASAYDCALTLGLANLQPLSVELQKEEQKIDDYFASRLSDEPNVIIPKYRNPR